MATVFPEPVCDDMRMSRPASSGASIASCTGMSAVKPRFSSALASARPTS